MKFRPEQTKKAGAIVVIAAMALIFMGTRYIRSEVAPYFIVKDSFQSECYADKPDKCHFIILQPINPIRLVASVQSMEELPLNGEAQQCKISRISEKANENEYNRLHVICKKWEGDVNAIVFESR